MNSQIAGQIGTRSFHEKHSQHANTKQIGGPQIFYINLWYMFYCRQNCADKTEGS